jgi:RNA polymerase sigma-70 factor, ECF subfamily
MNLVALQDFESYLYFLATTQLRKLKLGLWEPQDIVQETLLRAFKNSSQYRGATDAELAAWLRSILCNYLSDLARRSGRQLDVQALNAELEQSSIRLESWLACEQPTPRRRTLQQEAWKQMQQSLQQLPDSQRIAIELRYLHGLGVKEIATEMKRSLESVGGLLQRGLRKLRENFQHD